MLADRPVPAAAGDGTAAATGTAASTGTVTPMVTTESPPQAPGFYLQLGAYSRAEGAEQLKGQLASAGLAELQVVRSGAVVRLFSGPFASRQEAQDAMRKLPAALKLKPLVVQR